MINTIGQRNLKNVRKRSGMFSAELVMTLPLFGIILAGLF